MMRIRLKAGTMILLLFFFSAIVLVSGSSWFEKKSEGKKERLLASHLIFRMNDLIYKKWALFRAGIDHTNAQKQREAALSKELQEMAVKIGMLDLSPGEREIGLKLQEHVRHLLASDQDTATQHKNELSGMSKPYYEALAQLRVFADVSMKEEAKFGQQEKVATAATFISLEFQSAMFIIFLLCLLALLQHTWIKCPMPAGHHLN